MWRNKGGRHRKRGGFARGQGRQFGSNDQNARDNQRREELRDSSWSRYEDNWQDNRDSDRNFRPDPREYDIDQDRYDRSGLETSAASYGDNRDVLYPDIRTTGFDVHDDLRDTALYREQDIDRRNVVQDLREYGGFDDRRDDLYRVDRRSQELDDFRNRDQALRTDYLHRSMEPTNIDIDGLNRYDIDRDFRNDQPDVRDTQLHHERQDNFRDSGINHHHSDSTRKEAEPRARFGQGDNKGRGGRVGRLNSKAGRFNEKKPAFKVAKNNRPDDKGKNNSRSRDRLDRGERHDTAKRSTSNDRKNKGTKFSSASKADDGGFKRNSSGLKSGHKSGTDSKHEHKKSEDQKSSVSATKSSKSSAKDKNNQKTSNSSKNDHNKHGSDRKQRLSSSDKKTEDGKKQSSNSTRTESGSFKKPGEIQHQPRPRSNSGRKTDSEFGHFHDEDILSIMADDDGFEKEMKTYANTGGRSGSRNRGSRERGNSNNMDRKSSERQPRRRDRESGERQLLSKDKGSGERHPVGRDRGSNERQPLNRDGGSGERHQLSRDRGGGERHQLSRDRGSGERHLPSRDRGSGERQQHSRDRNDKNNYDSNIKPAFDKHTKANTKTFGEASQNVNESKQFRRPSRIQNDNRNMSSTSTNRFRPDVSQGLRNTNNRQNFRQTGRNNNNTVGGRSRFFVASKIKDSYLKRRNTFYGAGNKRFGNRQPSKPLNVDNQSLSARQKTHGKNEIGISGAVLKDDRIRENRSSDFRRDHDRQDDDKKGNKYDRNHGPFPFRQNNLGNTTGHIYQRDGAKFDDKERFSQESFKSRGLASQRVKQKYSRGGFGQNRNHSKGFRGGQKNHGRQKRGHHKQWDRRSVVDKNKYSDVTEQVDIPDTEQQLHDQPLEPNQQQVIFLPNTDIQSGQPHMIDQFGQVILNPEVDVQQGEEQVPFQYMPQQFHPDGVPPGEQVVFIPFVNNQVPPGYSENLPLAYDQNADLPNEGSSMPEGRQRKNSETSGFKVAGQGRKPLSKEARASLRRTLEIKRKQRMEKEIEKKLLKKLLSNPDVNKAMRESTELKKKSIIKRISPPSASKSNTSDKKYKLVRRGNNSGELEDVSEDEAKYDNVSDLEDVSESEDVYEGNDEYESRQGKRPVFRKPGQPRKNRNVPESSRDMTASSSGDIRRVVDHNTQQQDNRHTLRRNDQPSRVNPADSKQGVKSRRSVYIENPNDNVENVTGQKRATDSSKYENKPLKKRRSISPIEITVSNDRYSKGTSMSSENVNQQRDKYDSSKRKDERKSDYRQRYSEEENPDGRFDRTKNERKGNDRHQDNREREKQRCENKGSRMPEKSDQADIDEKRYTKDRNYRAGSDTEESYRRKGHSKSWEKEQSSSGKYNDNKDYRVDEEKDRNWHKRERNYSKNEDVTDKNEDRGDRNDEKRSHGSDRRGDDPYRSRSDRDDRKRDRSREGNRNERRRSLSRDRSLPEDRNTGRSSQRQERNRAVNQDQGSNRNTQGNTNTIVSGMSQNQFQMNQSLMQQSMQHQPFITAQSHSVPLHGQSVLQFSNSGNTVDHSLPPVQNSPMSMPPFPPPNLGIRPDMSLPPPLMNVVGTPTSMSTMVIQQQPTSLQYQQQQPIQHMSMQQQPMQQQQQQQQFQNIQPQFQQQQFQQLQSQPQIIQQQSNTPNFQSHQAAYSTNLQSNQLSLQQMQSGQFQQTQSGVNMMPVNQNQMQNQQTGSINQGPTRVNQQGIHTSGNQSYVATTPQQALRGVIGTLKPAVDGSKAVIRAQPVRIAASVNQVSRSPTTMSRRPVNTKQSSFVPSGSFGSHYRDDEENEVEEDDFLEMLCSKCDKVFLSHEVMRRHGRWHDMVESNTKTWRCDQCEQGFSTSSGHADHMSVKHARDSWNCSLCDMSFSNSSGLNRHVRHASHKDLKVKFVCSLCPASFMVLMHLVQHKKDNHQSNMGYSGLRKY